MELNDHVTVPVPPRSVFPFVADLVSYPLWLTIVDAVVTVEGGWVIDLRGRLGVVSRSKRLRMERTAFQADHRVRFERNERDGREHAAWTLDVRLDAAGADATEVTMVLGYSGTLWGPVFERMLSTEISAAKARLLALVGPG